MRLRAGGVRACGAQSHGFEGVRGRRWDSISVEGASRRHWQREQGHGERESGCVRLERTHSATSECSSAQAVEWREWRERQEWRKGRSLGTLRWRVEWGLFVQGRGEKGAWGLWADGAKPHPATTRSHVQDVWPRAAMLGPAPVSRDERSAAIGNSAAGSVAPAPAHGPRAVARTRIDRHSLLSANFFSRPRPCLWPRNAPRCAWPRLGLRSSAATRVGGRLEIPRDWRRPIFWDVWRTIARARAPCAPRVACSPRRTVSRAHPSPEPRAQRLLLSLHSKTLDRRPVAFPPLLASCLTPFA